MGLFQLVLADVLDGLLRDSGDGDQKTRCFPALDCCRSRLP